MGHSVDDVAALLDVMASRSDGPESFLVQARTKPKRMRIRMTVTSPLVSATPAVAEAVKRVAKLLEDLGHRVEEGSPPEGSLEEFLPLWQYAIARAPVLRPSQLQPITRWLFDAGKPLTRAQIGERHRMLEERLDAWFGDADLYLTPTVAEPPPPIGVLAGMGPEEGFTRAARIGAFTAIFNITGQPAANIPAGIGEDNLPIGVQLAGPRDADGLVLAVARELEEAMPWRNRRPRNP
jgi:amidase